MGCGRLLCRGRLILDNLFVQNVAILVLKVGVESKLDLDWIGNVMLFMSNHAPAVLIFPNDSLLLAFPNSRAAANDSILDDIPIFFFLFVFVNRSYREAEDTLAVLRVIITAKSIVTMAAEHAAENSVTTTGVTASSK
jgi:hypothetical protein